MAKKQTRRCISVNREDYEAAKVEAERRGVTLAVLVKTALGAIGVPVVESPRQTPELVRIAAARRAASIEAREKTVRRPSRERQLLGDQIADACGFA